MTDEVEITDGDREAAASVAVLVEMRELILAGKADHHAEPWARRRMAGYQQAIADVVEWLRVQQHGRISDNYPGYYARQIEQRFGKDA